MSKYGAKKVIYESISFDSSMERDYFIVLQGKKKNGEIKDFELQPKFELLPSFEKNGVKYRSIDYVADFKVIHNNGEVVIVDVKGFETTDFKLKAKLFNYKYNETLLLLSYNKIDGWVELGQLKKNRKERKKLKAEEDEKKRLAQELRESLYMSELELSKIENIIDSNLELKPRYKTYLLRYIKENFPTIANMVKFDASKMSKSYRKNIIKIIEIIKGVG